MISTSKGLRGWPKRSTPLWKRSLDVSLATLGFLVTIPFWILIPIAIKLDDGGSIFFGHRRTGQAGERFTLWKFRTMLEGHDSPLDKSHPDRRALTRVGQLIRPLALDELPQFWNILQGDMTFVGPRPFQTWDRDDNLTEASGFIRRHASKPGLTGVSQIYLPRDASYRRTFRYDIFYINNCSLWLDIKLIIRSILISLLGKWPKRG